MKLEKFKSVFIVFVFFLFSGCSMIKPLELEKVNSFKIEEKRGGGVVIFSNLTIFNPNIYTYRVNSADIDVYIEKIHAGKLIIPNDLQVNAKGNFTGDFYLELSFPKVLLLGANALSKIKSGTFEVQLKGKVNTSFLIFNKTVEFDEVERIRLKGK